MGKNGEGKEKEKTKKTGEREKTKAVKKLKFNEMKQRN